MVILFQLALFALVLMSFVLVVVVGGLNYFVV
jgi:hypothetical protein